MRCLVLAALSLAFLAACQPATTELTEERRAAIAEELTQAFDGYAAAVRQLDQDGVLSFFQQSEDLAFAEYGAITRSWSALAELVRQRWPMYASVENFQWGDLHIQALAPHVAAVTNLTPNHLDWHDTLESYTHAKQNILRFQQKTDHAILNRQDPALSDWPTLTPAQIHWTHTDHVAQLELPLPGDHNRQNAAAALAVAKIFNINFQTTQQALKNFQSLPHRLQLIRRLHEVAYYNDSIATTPQSVLAAIAAIPQKKILILGGCDKNIPFDDLINTLVNPPVPNSSVETVILIGQTQNKLASLLESEKKKQNSKTPHTQIAPTMQDAVTIAQKIATPHSAILLSPGCASYDMFKNFENRGNTFSSLVNDLPD
ncbi:MAG: hypothetical protein IID32_11330 [Planctomycetes bacterium]|nr:hypothetical protein [Planctomycetota bacterium]